MSASKKKLVKSIFRSELGCVCGKTKLPDVIQPQPIRPRISTPLNNHKSNSTSSMSCEDHTSTTFSLNIDTSPHFSESENDPTATMVVTPRTGSPSPPSSSAAGGSIAVVKESDDPYSDFRNSMLQMILEKGIYSRDGLEDLLRCFLELNSPCYHGLIIRAFTDIWNGVISDHRRKDRPGSKGKSREGEG